MKKQTTVGPTVENRLPKALIWTAVIIFILLCATGIAAMMGWTPDALAEKDVSVSAASKPRQTAATAPSSCRYCGVIESTRVVSTPGETGVVGVIGGAVVGGALGNQVGSGSGKKLATIAGAVGGAVAGNQIEKHMNAGKQYETTVRFDDGSSRAFLDPAPTQWRQGDRVKVVNDTIVSR